MIHMDRRKGETKMRQAACGIWVDTLYGMIYADDGFGNLCRTFHSKLVFIVDCIDFPL
jgi:hypothetical protein